MRRAFVWIVPLVACHPASAPQTSHVALPPAPAVSAPLASGASPDLCARIREEQNAKVRAAIAESKRAQIGEWTQGVEGEILDAFFSATKGMGLACHPFARGAWALEAQSITLYASWRSAAAELVAVAYVGGDRFVGDEPMHAGYGAMFTRVDSRLASDYDGDGVPELWMHSEEEGVEGGHVEESRLVTAAAKVVKPYVPADAFGEIEEVRDVDGDGRGDLVADLGVRLVEGVVCEGKSDWSPAKFVAHALPDGSFSTNDAVAKGFIRSWCAAPPTVVRSPEEALCARLWNAPRKLVTSSCVVWDCALEVASKPQPKLATRDCENRIRAYDSAVPFTLP